MSTKVKTLIRLTEPIQMGFAQVKSQLLMVQTSTQQPTADGLVFITHGLGGAREIADGSARSGIPGKANFN